MENSRKQGDLFYVFVDGVQVVGKVETLEKYYVSVELVSPYKGFVKNLIRSGYAKMIPKTFLDKNVEECNNLLKQLFLRVREFDDQFFELAHRYQKLMKCKAELERIRKAWISEGKLEPRLDAAQSKNSNEDGVEQTFQRMESKLEDGLFGSFNGIVSYDDQNVFLSLLEKHRKTGKKPEQLKWEVI